MRIPNPFRRASHAPAPTPAETAPVASSTRSYDMIPGWTYRASIGSQYDQELYKLMVDAFPFLDVALRKLTRMVTPFEVTCDNESTKEAIELWLRNIRVGSISTGFQSFAYPYVRQVLQYGESAGEIVLAESKRDVAELQVVDRSKLRLIRDEKAGILLGESRWGQDLPYPDQGLFTFTSWGREGDNPHGTSLMRSIPFIADIVLRMENAVRQTWQRYGSPSFLVQFVQPADIETSDTQFSTYRSAIQAEWQKGMVARWENQGIIDFFSAGHGTVTVQALGSDKVLAFDADYRPMVEQIIASTELAPFMLGIQWSTTERLSQQQADAIIAQVDGYRAELEPDWMQILDWVQRTQGLRGTVGIEWDDVGIQDKQGTAQADLTSAQAQKLKIENAKAAWTVGWIDQLQAAEMAGVEIDEVVRELDTPADAVPQLAAANQGTPAQGGQPPPPASQNRAAMDAWGEYPDFRYP